MNPENVLKLVEAGFTAEEIRGMLKLQTPDSPASASLPLSPEPTGAAITETEEAAPAEAPVQEKGDAVAEAVDKALSERLEQINSGFETMYKNMQKLAGMPSMADIQPKGVEDIISKFFKEE